MVEYILSLQGKPELLASQDLFRLGLENFSFFCQRTHDEVIVRNSHCPQPMKGLCSKTSLCEIVIKDEAHTSMKTMWEL